MKKILSLVLVLALCLSLGLCLLSCGANDPVGNATLVIATEEKAVYDVPLSKLSEGKGLIPVFEYLKEEKGLEYVINGTMLESVGGLTNDYDLGSYIYIYTSVEKDFDVSEYKMEIEYEGKTLVSSGVGFNEMSVTDGAIIYIGLISWG
jgi:hypothetical protein